MWTLVVRITFWFLVHHFLICRDIKKLVIKKLFGVPSSIILVINNFEVSLAVFELLDVN